MGIKSSCALLAMDCLAKAEYIVPPNRDDRVASFSKCSNDGRYLILGAKGLCYGPHDEMVLRRDDRECPVLE
jgi:hypothetical protein